MKYNRNTEKILLRIFYLIPIMIGSILICLTVIIPIIYFIVKGKDLIDVTRTYINNVHEKIENL